MNPSLRRKLLLAVQIAAIGSSLSQLAMANESDSKEWIVRCELAVTKGYVHSTESCKNSFKKAFQKMGCGPSKPACNPGDGNEIECKLEVSNRCQGLPPGKETCDKGFITRKITWSKSHELKFCQPGDRQPGGGDTKRNMEMFDSAEDRAERERKRRSVEEGKSAGEANQ